MRIESRADMRRLALLITLVVFLTWPAALPRPARAQEPVTLDVTVDRNEVTVGDRIAVTVLLRAPSAVQPNLSGLETQFGDLDVLVIGLPEERSVAGGMKEIRVRYEVAAFQLGPVELPALTVLYTGPDGAPASVSAAPVSLNVVSVIPPGADAADVRDLKPQIDLPFSAGVSRQAVAGAIAFVVVVSLAAGLAGWWLWRRQHPAPAIPAVAVSAESPEEAARTELDRIAALRLLEQGDLVQFHALLAVCIRRYLSERYGFPAVAMTTSELRARMEQYGVGRWQARLAAGLLAECDAVRYARYAPARARAETNLQISYEIVAVTAEPAGVG